VTTTITTAITGTENNPSDTLSTITATEIDILLLRSLAPTPAGTGAGAGTREVDVWTTLTYLTTPLFETASPTPTNKYIVVPPYPTTSYANANADAGTGGGGWNSWSSAQQGGLIAGMVIVGMALLGLLWWACLQSRIWVARDVAYGEDLRGSNDRRKGKGTGKGWVYDLAGQR
jgi:hypothetical protein